MSKYQDWMKQQDKSFIAEVLGENLLTHKFIDHNFKPITLTELKALDEKFINNSLEGGEDNE